MNDEYLRANVNRNNEYIQANVNRNTDYARANIERTEEKYKSSSSRMSTKESSRIRNGLVKGDELILNKGRRYDHYPVEFESYSDYGESVVIFDHSTRQYEKMSTNHLVEHFVILR